MIAGRDSEFAPTDAQLDAFYADGVRVYGGYLKFGNDGVANGWTQADFARVKAHGMTAIGFFSGWASAAQVKAVAAAWGILACLDDESGMRPDGPWTQPDLDATGAGLYGNPQFHAGRVAKFHVMADYLGFDPKATWPSWLARPSTPCGWQVIGSHTEHGLTVDSAWYDDSFAPEFTGGSGTLPGEDLNPQTEAHLVSVLDAFIGESEDPASPYRNKLLYLMDGGDKLNEILAAAKAAAPAPEPVLTFTYVVPGESAPITEAVKFSDALAFAKGFVAAHPGAKVTITTEVA